MIRNREGYDRSLEALWAYCQDLKVSFIWTTVFLTDLSKQGTQGQPHAWPPLGQLVRRTWEALREVIPTLYGLTGGSGVAAYKTHSCLGILTSHQPPALHPFGFKIFHPSHWFLMAPL